VSDFSVELEGERIADRRTKAYFREVYSSYVAGNHRSAAVMLWSVVVCDVLFKLDELRYAYADATAINILDEVTNMQAQAPTSPEWELSLIERAHKETNLLDAGEYQGLVALQRQRHLSAHPVLTGTYELYEPSREAVRAAIRHALEALLTKPAFMSKKAFDALTEDLELVRDTLPDEQAFRRYLDAKYLSKLRAPTEDQVLRSMWRLVFKVVDPRAETNRIVNFRALRAMVDRRPETVVALVQKDRDYFSNVAPSDSTLGALAGLLGYHPKIFSILTEAAKTLLHANADKDDKLALSWFLRPNMQSHLAKLLELAQAGALKVNVKTFEQLYAACADPAERAAARLVAIELYVRAGSYDTADRSFELVRSHVDECEASELQRLLQGAEQNDQAHGRGRARADHALVKTMCERVIGAGFDSTPYPKMVASWT